MTIRNFVLDSDSYKYSHSVQYPPGAEVVSSHITPRSSKLWQKVCVFGLQPYLKSVLSYGRVFDSYDIDEAKALIEMHGEPFNVEAWNRLYSKHKGRLPLLIRAVPEGTVVDIGNPIVDVENTDPEFPWLTSFIETPLLRAVWYPTTVATQSWHLRQLIYKYLVETSDDPDSQIGFKLHDFGARGVSSFESAMLGGMAHLVNFLGTDTVSALVGARRFYGEPCAGFSIPAAEHSTITSWGPDREEDAYANMLEQFGKPGALFAVVSDSYDIYNAVQNIWGGTLRQRVLDSGATLVVRPDSGDPVKVVPRVIGLLMDTFGSELNKKGYHVLNKAVRVIQGDGVNPQSIEAILNALKAERISAENIAFGMGGALLQQVNRDTLGFAMKASAIRINGEWHDVFKKPITDPGKNSRGGRLSVVYDSALGRYKTVRRENCGAMPDLLRPVFKDGELLVDDSFATVRKRAAETSL